MKQFPELTKLIEGYTNKPEHEQTSDFELSVMKCLIEAHEEISALRMVVAKEKDVESFERQEGT